ncbi:MAG TPA: hemolysin III family protein [Anaerohalosphaeraceae bacterium]|nr:hemolysin III family protein [Anaerohalosphaeraceae bacterium]HRT49355.1 hemolysin III family protein [Anaerohalosphaeraceae bacterium]HRT85916.1 hemolysin III family protein [Anaerohalosphaeraceae bacterium]
MWGWGWLCLAAVKQIVMQVPAPGVWLLLGGGIAYTSGVVFYAWRRLPYSHAIWHVWVLCGSTLHFFSVITTLGGRRGGIVR